MNDLNEPMGYKTHTTKVSAYNVVRAIPTRPCKMPQRAAYTALPAIIVYVKEPVRGQIAGRYNLNEAERLMRFIDEMVARETEEK